MPNGMLRGTCACKALTHTTTTEHTRNRTIASAGSALLAGKPPVLMRSVTDPTNPPLSPLASAD